MFIALSWFSRPTFILGTFATSTLVLSFAFANFYSFRILSDFWNLCSETPDYDGLLIKGDVFFLKPSLLLPAIELDGCRSLMSSAI